MKKKLIFYTVALAAGLLTACSSDDEQETPIRPISVEVSQRPMTSDDEAGERKLPTRGAITTTETFSEFSMKGIYDDDASNYSVSKSGGTWTVSPNTWPSGAPNEASIPFYAYSDGTFYANAGTPYVSFTMAENASTQYDLLVATNTVSYSSRQGKVPLTFDHACAAVAFNVKITNKLKTEKLNNASLTVNSIVLRNVSNTGRYYFGSTPAWQDVSGSANYTLTDGNITVDTEAQALRSNYLFVIPQRRAANGTTGTYLEINYDSNTKQATIPLTTNWEAGYEYTIIIQLGTTLIQ